MARRGDPRPPRGPEVLGNPFTEIPYEDLEEAADPRERFMGHPTASGPKDPNSVRHGMTSPGNGDPGIPMIPLGPGHRPGIPGTFVGAPMQPGAGLVEEEL